MKFRSTGVLPLVPSLLGQVQAGLGLTAVQNLHRREDVEVQPNAMCWKDSSISETISYEMTFTWEQMGNPQLPSTVSKSEMSAAFALRVNDCLRRKVCLPLSDVLLQRSGGMRKANPFTQR